MNQFRIRLFLIDKIVNSLESQLLVISRESQLDKTQVQQCSAQLKDQLVFNVNLVYN